MEQEQPNRPEAMTPTNLEQLIEQKEQEIAPYMSKLKAWRLPFRSALRECAEKTASVAMSADIPNELGAIHAQADIKLALDTWLGTNDQKE